ncbi:GPR endopeptidase [Clostridium sp. D2Q-11]|uniref:GPR endopeptidase n=1 Tax=Anaeromonas frigoriresistens TaxID=2683708 RepID=A0A942UPL9_9FIRM|nr:GPR endopeptidase [Anaeromonas frigoriresistens]MBS4536868.1 GPR endopeptidase [Anaeromonas frigoriresistens]
MFQIRTDLAVEAREIYNEGKEQEVPGVEVEREEQEDYTITRIKILNELGQQKLNKKVGSYVTIESPSLKRADQDLKDNISKVLAKELKAIIAPNKHKKALIVGLGNRNVTPDALGPKVVEKVLVTRHFFQAYNKTEDESMANVSAISPGVMGLTGIETGEIIKGIVEKTNPDIVIAVDALASRNMRHISSTIQISDTGISPGSGVGNKRKPISAEYLGVPVIAVGIPTVVDAATLINDTIGLIIGEMKNQTEEGQEFYSLLEGLSSKDKYSLIKEVLTPYMDNVMVTPKEVDDLINDLSQVVSNGINISVHPGIDLKDVNRYLN